MTVKTLKTILESCYEDVEVNFYVDEPTYKFYPVTSARIEVYDMATEKDPDAPDKVFVILSNE